MRYLSLVFVALFLVACHKEEDSQPKAAQTPRPMAPFSCSDSSDDGQFEVWNDTVKALIFGPNPKIIDPDSVVRGYILSIDSVSQNISLADPEFRFRAVYDTALYWSLFFDLVDASRGVDEAYGSVYINNHKSLPDTAVNKISFKAFPGGLTTGCKRIYYYGFKTDSAFDANLGVLHPLSGTVLFKGHYDVQVN